MTISSGIQTLGASPGLGAAGGSAAAGGVQAVGGADAGGLSAIAQGGSGGSFSLQQLQNAEFVSQVAGSASDGTTTNNDSSSRSASF